jgi:hypothetical protein
VVRYHVQRLNGQRQPQRVSPSAVLRQCQCAASVTARRWHSLPHKAVHWRCVCAASQTRPLSEAEQPHRHLSRDLLQFDCANVIVAVLRCQCVVGWANQSKYHRCAAFKFRVVGAMYRRSVDLSSNSLTGNVATSLWGLAALRYVLAVNSMLTRTSIGVRTVHHDRGRMAPSTDASI